MITGDTSFSSDLGIDSLDMLEIFQEVEKQFSISIPDEEGEQLKTVSRLVKYINKQNN